MTSSHRGYVASVKEDTVGTTPGSPRMRTRRPSTEDMRAAGVYAASNEVRSDRQVADPIQVSRKSGGAMTYPMVFPFPDSPTHTDLESAFYNTFVRRPERFNDGGLTPITNIATTNTVLTVSSGTTFQLGHLVRFSGMGVAGNNGVFRCTTASATVPRFVGSGITNETPPAGARVKVVGFQGTSGDITATATGLGSTALDFTTLGLSVGDWIKIGGSNAGTRFATAALNGVARIAAIGVTALTLDNRPTGWTTDVGSSKTISVWIGDTLVNGTTQIGQTIERGLLDVSGGTTEYTPYVGQVVSEWSFRAGANAPIETSVRFDGLGVTTPSTSPLDASPDAAQLQSTFPVFVGRMHIIAAGGLTGGFGNNVSLTAPAVGTGTCRTASIRLNNNPVLREVLGAAYPRGISGQSINISGSFEEYYSTQATASYNRNGTVTSLIVYALNAAVGQGFLISIPRATISDSSNGSIAQFNQNINLTWEFMASVDEAVTGKMISFTAFEYIE